MKIYLTFQVWAFLSAGFNILNLHNFVAKLYYFILFSKNMWLTLAQCCKKHYACGQNIVICGKKYAIRSFFVCYYPPKLNIASGVVSQNSRKMD